MNENVLREFLVSLGFEVDEVGLKKFSTAVEGVTKGVLAAGAAVAATAAGVVGGVKVISDQMEKLYYASQRTGETTGNIMALRYAAGQIGLTADQAQASLEGFARTLRLNPGTDSLLKHLGVTGDTPTDRFESFIAQTTKMKPYIAAAYAGLFGIDPDTLLMLENGLPKLEEEQHQYKARLAKFRITPEDAAKVGVDFNNDIRRAKDDFTDLWIVIESKLLPVLNPLIDKFERWSETHAGDVANEIADGIQAIAMWISHLDWDDVSDKADKFLTRAEQFARLIGNIVAGMLQLANWVGGGGPPAPKNGTNDYRGPHPEDSPFVAWVRSKREAAEDWFNGTPGQPAAPSAAGQLPAPTPASQTGPASLFSMLEERYGLPQGLLDAGWSAESGRGKNMLSPKGAMGHFGFMPATAREYGVTDPNNLVEAARGAAQKFADLIQHYHGNLQKAIAGYNWGEGNLDSDIAKWGVNWATHLPGETAGYLRKFDGVRLGDAGVSRSVNVTNKTDIHVTGSGDPNGTARSVAREQDRTNANIVRNLSGLVR